MEETRIRNSPTAQRRQKQIEDCLYRNMLHAPYASISVTDLCRQVGISRKAFYNYYRDKDACFSSYIGRLLQDAMLYITTTLPDDASPLDTAVALLDYWKSKKEFFDITIRNNLVHLLLMQNMEYVLHEDRTTLDLLSTPEVKSDTDILACYVASQLTLVLQWHFRGFDSPTEEMAQKLLRIVHAPMIQVPDVQA